MFDKIINRIGVSLALILMICELTYVNAKSLLYLTADTSSWDRLMSVVGSLAFSMVTVVVMRKAGNGWFKVIFPLFDAALVFLGFNITQASSIIDGSDSPVRFWLTVFLAVFTGVITYSLGIINYRDHNAGELVTIESDIDNRQSEYEALISELRDQKELLEVSVAGKERHIRALQSDIETRQSDIAALRSEMEDRESDHQAIKGHLATTQKELNRYRDAYLRAEASRIRKKNEANRTPEELEILRQIEAN